MAISGKNHQRMLGSVGASRIRKRSFTSFQRLSPGNAMAHWNSITLQEGRPWSQWASCTSWCHGLSRLSLMPVVFPSKCVLGLITRKDQSKAGSAGTRACSPRGGEVKTGPRAWWSASLAYLVSSRIERVSLFYAWWLKVGWIGAGEIAQRVREHTALLLLQRTQVWFSRLTWWPTAIFNSRSPFWPPQALHTLGAQTNMLRKHPRARRKQFKSGAPSKLFRKDRVYQSTRMNRPGPFCTWPLHICRLLWFTKGELRGFYLIFKN